MRVDKWLWTARIVKTRTSAAAAVKGGRVHVNGQAAKPSRELRPGDVLSISLGQVRLDVIVRGFAPRRVPAAEAAALYDETGESRAAREHAAELRRVAGPVPGQRGGRPTTRDRRRMGQRR